MASAELSRRVGRGVAYSPLVEMDDQQRREIHEALLDVDAFEDLPGTSPAGGRRGGTKATLDNSDATAVEIPCFMRVGSGPGPGEHRSRPAAWQ